MMGEYVSQYIPTRSYGTGFGPLDSSIDWDRDETTGDLVLNIVTRNGEHAAGITFNRVALADLIADLALALR